MFLWDEIPYIKLDEKIDHEKFSSYFTCIGFVVGICSIVGLYLQILKSEDDKHNIHKPLLFPKQSLTTTISQFGTESPAKPPFVDVSDNHAKCFVMLNGSVTVQNAGMGLAKKATFYWEYDHDDLLDFIKKRSEKSESEEEKVELFEIWRFLSSPVRQKNIEMQVQVIDKEESINILPPLHYILCLLNASQYICIPRFPREPPKLILVAKYYGFFDREFEQKFLTCISHKIDYSDAKIKEFFQLDFIGE